MVQEASVGLFFGSFNPIHVGHLIIANYMATQTGLREVWLVVSPHNPFKQKHSLARDYDRLHLARLAIEDNPRLRVSDIEFGLPKPSYTIDTLTYLKEKHPDRKFVLIVGSDNLSGLTKWKNYQVLVRDYEFYVYMRPGFDPGEWASLPGFRFFREVPQMDISASYIRDCLLSGKSIQYLVTEPVFRYIKETGLYQKR